jgi:spermidine synthase
MATDPTAPPAPDAPSDGPAAADAPTSGGDVSALLHERRRQRAVALLVPLFVFSGATSLVYETLWERQLHLVVGTSQIGVITVLTAFMAGLAAGGFLASRRADTIARPLRAYGLLEGAIGVYAVIFPFLIQALVPVYTTIYEVFSLTPSAFAVVQFLLLGLFLLPPTICMGATLPILARFAHAATSGDEAGKQVGRLYGANTIGAVCGVGLAGFVLLPGYGLSATTWITAGGNVLLCALAFGLDAWTGSLGGSAAPEDAAAAPQTATEAGPWLKALGPLAALAGMTALVYEVSWFRVMVLTLGGSAYAFSIMLLSFLLGIGSGGWVGGRIADWAWRRDGLRGTLRAFAVLQLCVGVLAYGVMWQYGELPYWFIEMYAVVKDYPSHYLWVGKLGLAMMIMVPPAVFMGASFPVLVRAATVGDALGQPVGRIYGWNTVGSILGASVGGLFLLPTLFVTGTVLLAVSCNLVGGAIAMWAAGQSGPDKAKGAAQVGWVVAAAWAIGLVQWARPPWDPLLMTAGMYKYASHMDESELNRAGVNEFAIEPYELVYYAEGLSSVVTVARSKDSGNMWLANNGKVDASTQIDMPTQVMVAHLPFVFQPEPEDVLVIGLASGITAGSAVLHSDAGHFEIIELEPAIVEASHFFDEHNHRPLEDPRVELIANDGRNHLFLQPDGRYQLIISEPSNPWLTGVSNLFTKEFFELGKSKLDEGGVWAQWVQMYGMDHEDLRSLLHTFTSTYRYVHLFSTIEDADLVLIGSDAPLDMSADRIGAMMDRDKAVRDDFKMIDVESPEDVLTRYLVDQDKILQFAGDAPLNTDDNMRIEYSAPRHLHEETADENFMRLLDGSDARYAIPMQFVKDVPGMLDLAEAYTLRDDYLKATMVMKKAMERAPEDPVVFERFVEYQEELRMQLEAQEEEKADDSGED